MAKQAYALGLKDPVTLIGSAGSNPVCGKLRLSNALATVAELVDAPDLKSGCLNWQCGFDSHRWHIWCQCRFCFVFLEAVIQIVR